MKRRIMIYICLAVIAISLWIVYKSMTGSFFPHDLSAYKPASNTDGQYYILPIGNVDKPTLDYMKQFLESDSKLKSVVLPSIPIPDNHGNREKQVDVDKLRPLLTRSGLVPSNAFRVIGLTMDDIYWKDYNFIFGLGGVGANGCIVSLNRMVPKGINEQSMQNTLHPGVKLYKDRIRTIIRHELGHTFGLSHCDTPGCAMKYDDNIVDFDNSGEYFCPQCSLAMHLSNLNK